MLVVKVANSIHLMDQAGRLFMGTSIATGTAVAKVFSTGMKTELGKIAHLIATA